MSDEHDRSGNPISTLEPLLRAIQSESLKFQEYYLWLEKAMPPIFLEEISSEDLILISHNLMRFDLQDYFATINLKHGAIVICLDSVDADLRVLQNYPLYGIKNYRTYVSLVPPPFNGVINNLRIAVIEFTGAEPSDKSQPIDSSWLLEFKNKIQNYLYEKEMSIDMAIVDELIQSINIHFLKVLSIENAALVLHLFHRAQTRDYCQYEVIYNRDWIENKQSSMHIVLAWRNTPKNNFLFRMAQVIYRYNLVMARVNATYISPYSKDSILIMVLALHGANGKAAWEVTDIPTFLREMVTVKYFSTNDKIQEDLVSKRIIDGNMGNLLRAMVRFIHQALVYVDHNLYTIEHIREALCRHHELTVMICDAFKYKFDPLQHNLKTYDAIRESFLLNVAKLDTGHEENDKRRRNVLLQAMNFIHHTYKTNFYRTILSSFCFRLDPKYLDELPFDRRNRFPELPYAIFFIKGLNFFGFHIRFKNLARGGLRTVFPKQMEQMVVERNHVFSECYHLALTQHKKNKDIPEGGAKGIIFVEPFTQLEAESEILKRELLLSSIEPEKIEKQLNQFHQEQTLEFMYQAQRAFIEGLLTIVNCEADGKLKAKYIVDYWKKPEYLYLGPDENMHDIMIEWIADVSQRYEYKPGRSFISGKPHGGINHKKYGVTSLGVNVYMNEVLQYININPHKETFTIKMSGGPDGDVAGNQICNLYREYPDTAKLIALTDGSGTILDLNGLNLKVLFDLFHEGKAICHYPPEELSEGSFLVNITTKRQATSLVQQTLCYKKEGGKVVEHWISGSEMNHLYRHSMHQTPADIFIPAGGRPRTINENNYTDFLTDTGQPTAKAIIEGANLYLSPSARRLLEDLGVIIIKDSSANKAGVICSSFEILCGLTLTEEEFVLEKDSLVKEILERLKLCALNEAHLLLKWHKETGEYLTDISDEISNRINLYCYQILDYLDTQELSNDIRDPFVQCFLKYCLPTLRNKYQDRLMKEIPEHHKKAIIACYIASGIVYQKGLEWEPSIIDILPVLVSSND